MKDFKKHMPSIVLFLIMTVSGLVIVGEKSVQAAIGIYVMIWANNIGGDLRRKLGIDVNPFD